MTKQQRLIHGINPFTISGISWCRGYRRGNHPYYNKLVQKAISKLPPLKKFFAKWHHSESGGDLFAIMYWSPAAVFIYGANGKILVEIACRSNHRAAGLCAEYKQQLDTFVQNLQMGNTST